MVDPLSYLSFQPVLHDWYGAKCSERRNLQSRYHPMAVWIALGGSEMQLRGERVRSWRDGSSDRSFMVVDPLSYFSFQPVLHDRCNKGRGMCHPVCGMLWYIYFCV